MLNKIGLLKIIATIGISVGVVILAGCGNNKGGDDDGKVSDGIVGTWSFEDYNECGFLDSKEFVFNSNGSGVYYYYRNDALIFAVSFTYSHTNETVYLYDEIDGSFHYSGGATFDFYEDEKYTKKSNGSCNGGNKPSTPTNVKATTNSSVVTITWNPVPEAKGYFISGGSLSDNLWCYWATNTNSVSIDWWHHNGCNDNVNGNGIENFFGREISTVYFKVAAVNDCGFSGQSTMLSVTRP
jgi:hypothetical protein